MKISLAQWMEINRLHQQAIKAINALDFKLMEIAINRNPDTTDFLNKLVDIVADAKADLLRIDPMPQSEWMGGPTSGPESKNTKTYMREPHVCPLPRRYFTAAEVAEAKKKWMLGDAPGDDLTGPKTEE